MILYDCSCVMLVRTACMFFHERETTFNHLHRILCFHEILWEKHGTRLINNKWICVNWILYVTMTAGERGWRGPRVCTIGDAERDCSTECQEVKKAPHHGVCLSACLLERRRKVFQWVMSTLKWEPYRKRWEREKVAQILKLWVSGKEPQARLDCWKWQTF